jgi:hypothetical protein
MDMQSRNQCLKVLTERYIMAETEKKSQIQMNIAITTVRREKCVIWKKTACVGLRPKTRDKENNYDRLYYSMSFRDKVIAVKRCRCSLIKQRRNTLIQSATGSSINVI